MSSLTQPPPSGTSYDGHIHLMGYPFLDSKEEYVNNSEACEVMHPRKNDPPLSVVDLSTCTIGSLQHLIRETDFFGFPCVLTTSSQLLDGYITRKDIQYVIGEGRHVFVCLLLLQIRCCSFFPYCYLGLCSPFPIISLL